MAASLGDSMGSSRGSSSLRVSMRQSRVAALSDADDQFTALQTKRNNMHTYEEMERLARDIIRLSGRGDQNGEFHKKTDETQVVKQPSLRKRLPAGSLADSASRDKSKENGEEQDNWNLEESTRDAMEEHLLGVLKPNPTEIRMLAMLGSAGEASLQNDYERIFEYFRHKNALEDAEKNVRRSVAKDSMQEQAQADESDTSSDSDSPKVTSQKSRLQKDKDHARMNHRRTARLPVTKRTTDANSATSSNSPAKMKKARESRAGAKTDGNRPESPGRGDLSSSPSLTSSPSRRLGRMLRKTMTSSHVQKDEEDSSSSASPDRSPGRGTRMTVARTGTLPAIPDGTPSKAAQVEKDSGAYGTS